MLHPSRQLWKSRLSSVALTQLEQHILGLRRDRDIPSETIPQRYFDFLRGGPAEPLVEVFSHNEMDLIGLARLTSRILSILSDPAGSSADGGELYGVSRILNRRGERALAGKVCEQALLYGLPAELEPAARREMALQARRRGDYAEANRFWEELLGCRAFALEAHEQLAIHYEHRTGDLQHALDLTRAALLELMRQPRDSMDSQRFYRRWHLRLQHRMSRLLDRIGEDPQPPPAEGNSP